jgi:hypothetical protein
MVRSSRSRSSGCGYMVPLTSRNVKNVQVGKITSSVTSFASITTKNDQDPNNTRSDAWAPLGDGDSLAAKLDVQGGHKSTEAPENHLTVHLCDAIGRRSCQFLHLQIIGYCKPINFVISHSAATIFVSCLPRNFERCIVPSLSG